MSNTFLLADSHFSHRGIVQFLRADGVTKERPWDTVEEMDEALVKNWNSVVRPKDKVYHLGDVCINRSALKILSRLNGEKRLIKGNHDVFRPEEYLEYFTDIRGSHTLDKYILTHVPVHPDSLERWNGNIHGHLHSNRVMACSGWPGYTEINGKYKDECDIDPRYFCVSMEQINYTPIAFEEVKRLMEAQQ